MGKELQRKEQNPLDTVQRKLPTRFPLGALRNEGVRQRRRASSVEIEGKIYVVVPGSEISYEARRAVISWERPMHIDELALEDTSSKGVKRLELGKLEFHGSRRLSSSEEDPNLVLYTRDGEVRIDQALGVPTVYVKDCEVKYEG